MEVFNLTIKLKCKTSKHENMRAIREYYKEKKRGAYSALLKSDNSILKI